MSTVEVLTQKEKELIAVAASIASGCQPCTEHHLKSVHEAGATEAEVRGAIDIALGVRNNATQIMAEAAHGNSAHVYPKEEQVDLLKQPVNELVSIGAALACNSVAVLEYHLTRAAAVGATTRQIKTATGIARSIRESAQEKADAVLGNLSRPLEVKPSEQPAEHSQTKRSDEHVTLGEEDQKESVSPPCGCS